MPPQGCKKVVATGARSFILMMEERCFGVLNADVENPETYYGTWKRLDMLSESIVNEIATFQSEALNPRRAVLRRNQGTGAVGGDISVELANNGYGWLIAQAIGKKKGVGTSNDPHTFLPVDSSGVASDETAGYLQNSDLYTSDEIHYDTDFSSTVGYEKGYYTVDPYSMEPSFTLLISRDGGTIKNESGSDPSDHLFFRYTGNRVNTWSISASPTEIATSTFSLLGRAESIQDIPVPTYQERPAVNDPFTGFNGTIEIDDEVLCVLGFELNLNNNFGTDQYCMGDRFRNSLPEGQRVIDGTITVEFTDLVQYSKFINGTSSTVEVLFDLLGDGTETMKIIIPKIEYNGTTPQAGGPEAINQELPFTAIFDETAGSLLTVPAYAPNGFDIAVEIVTAGTLV